MVGLFNEEQQARFDSELAALLLRYPPQHKAAALLPALRLCQEIAGYVSPEAMELVAARLGVAPVQAAEVATFYSMLRVEPCGRHVIEVCTNLSCSLRGAQQVLAYLEKKLGVCPGETSGDKKATLREVECLASCGTAPCMQVDEEHFENLTPKKIDEALARLS
jgi:NADH-quinone oxidoreductase subunit E